MCMQTSFYKSIFVYQKIKKLNNIKLIIGNGFDVHCGAKTTYKNYFEANKKYISIINHLKILFDYHSGLLSNNIEYLVKTAIEKLKEFNFWDIFFSLKTLERSNYDVRNINTYQYWCDVESEISLSLESKTNLSFCEKLYEELVNDHFITLLSKEAKALSAYEFIILSFRNIFMQREQSHSLAYGKKGFYLFLLESLKSFEKNFSEYINSQFTEEYSKNCINTITSLCNPDTIISIDSFNFHRHLGEYFNKKLTNINGYDEYGFFGIDDNLEFDVNDPEYIFTKSFRKTSNLIESEKHYVNTEPFDNVIIYGHSLNKSDFGYFFSIFDLLDLQDTKSTKKLVFAYSLYREDKELQKLEFELAVHNILKSYCVDRKINERLIETLLSTDRIIFYEIPVIEDYKSK